MKLITRAGGGKPIQQYLVGSRVVQIWSTELSTTYRTSMNRAFGRCEYSRDDFFSWHSFGLAGCHVRAVVASISRSLGLEEAANGRREEEPYQLIFFENSIAAIMSFRWSSMLLLNLASVGTVCICVISPFFLWSICMVDAPTMSSFIP